MKSPKARRRLTSSGIHLGFQIAPMIDVVFVILLFFIVTAGSSRKDAALDSKLPSPSMATPLVSPDPVEIKIDADGQVYVNEEAMEGTAVGQLSGLSHAIRDLKQAGSENETEFVIGTEPFTKYQRVVDVLDTLAKEKITKVTFQAKSED